MLNDEICLSRRIVYNAQKHGYRVAVLKHISSSIYTSVYLSFYLSRRIVYNAQKHGYRVAVLNHISSSIYPSVYLSICLSI